MTGNYRTEHLFALRQNFAAYEFLLRQIAEYDGEIEALLTTLAAQQHHLQHHYPHRASGVPSINPNSISAAHCIG